MHNTLMTLSSMPIRRFVMYPGSYMLPHTANAAGPWVWLYVGFHVIASFLIILILVLIAILLWKKIQETDNHEKHNYTVNEETSREKRKKEKES